MKPPPVRRRSEVRPPWGRNGVVVPVRGWLRSPAVIYGATPMGASAAPSARCRLGKGKKNAVFLLSSLGLHYFGFAQVGGTRERKRKSLRAFLFLSTRLHYLCPPITVRAGRAWPSARDEKGNRCDSCAVPLLCVPFFRRHATYSCHWLGAA